MKIKNYTIIGLCTFMALFSCKKDKDENIGAELTENPNKIGTVIKDDFKIVTYSSLEDSVTTSGKPYTLMGAINTEETGLAQSCLFISFAPDSLDRTFPSADFFIEKFELKLNINQVYGNPSNQEFEVFMIEEHINGDTTYYNFDSIPLGSKVGSFVINESDTGNFSFALDSAEGSRLMTLDESFYENYENFGELFQGVCIKPKTSSLSTNEGAIFKINSESAAIDFSFKTTNGMDDQYDTEIMYNVPSNQYIFSQFNHDFTGSDLQVLLNDTSLGQNSFHIQGMASGYGKIEFPEVQEWYNSDTANYLINNFKISFSAENGNYFDLPDSLVISYKQTMEVSREQFLFLDDASNSYSVEIPVSYVTAALNDTLFNKMEFRLFVPFQRENPQGVELYGELGITPPKLQIIATKF